MYASRDDLITRFGAEALAMLAVRHADGEELPGHDQVLDDALTDAHHEIDSYLRARYTLPLVPNGNTLQRCALDLAFYNLHENQVTELVEKRRDDWIKWLKDVAKGLVYLDVILPVPGDGSAVPVVDGGLVEFQSTRDAVFGKPY